MCQIYLRADVLNRIDSGCIQAFKDCLLFGVSEMLSRMGTLDFRCFSANTKIEKLLMMSKL